MNALRPVTRQSVSDAVVEQIVGLIRAGDLKPGDRLPPERDLSRQLGVGRTSLREALKSLTAVGIVEGRIGDGTFVATDSARFLERSAHWGMLLDPKAVDDLVEARLMLETQTVASAAERATDADVEALEAAIDALAAALGDRDAFLEADLRFHTAVAAASGNAYLLGMLAVTRSALQQWIARSLDDPASSGGRRRGRLSLEQHRAIAAAIRARDPDAARSAMRHHLLSSRSDLPRG